MAILVPNAAELVQIKNLLNHTAPQDQSLKLFTNNYTPVAASVAGDFAEASGGGYAAKSLTGTSWTVATNGSGQAEATYAAQTFTFTGALSGSASIYGYFVVQSSSGTIMWAERLANTFTPANNGDALTINPKFQLQSIN